jgi:hypothetical protein
VTKVPANFSADLTLKRATPVRESRRPRIVLVVSRGEAVRNFLYSDTLRVLGASADVTLLSVIAHEAVTRRVAALVDEVVALQNVPTPRHVALLRYIIENAHDRWLWSAVARNNWELRDRRAAETGARLRRSLLKIAARALAWEPILHALTRLEQQQTLAWRSTREFDELFSRIKPDLVFNCSHVHGIAGELPLRVASEMGIPTAGFIFSWDNLTSRSRIFVPYDHYLVWHDAMKSQLLTVYPRLQAAQIHVTGTPQFDFHFDPRYWLSREELCARLGIEPTRPYVLYTSGIWNHFFEEHRHVELVIRLLREWPPETRPQLVVRTYAKGTSKKLRQMATQRIPDVVFPEVAWDHKLHMPLFEDLAGYTSLLRHAALGINAASTVSLELLMLDKPVINLYFDPPDTNLPWCLGYERHIRFDHYWPVASSGATMVAKSANDMRTMLSRGLETASATSPIRQEFIKNFFGGSVPTKSGEAVANTLLDIANARRP